MAFKRYKHLNVPDSWERYFTKYPQGMSILESLFEWVSQVDSMVDNQNKLSANVEQFRIEIDEFVGRFDERLQDEVTQTLNDWQNSGFLDVVISEALQWELDNYIATNEQDKLSITAQLQQTENNLSDRAINVKYPPAPFVAAKGDGVSDDSLVIQNIIDNFNNVFIPEGTFKASIVLKRSGQVLKGTGRRSVIIPANNTWGIGINGIHINVHDLLVSLPPEFTGDGILTQIPGGTNSRFLTFSGVRSQQLDSTNANSAFKLSSENGWTGYIQLLNCHFSGGKNTLDGSTEGLKSMLNLQDCMINGSAEFNVKLRDVNGGVINNLDTAVGGTSVVSQGDNTAKGGGVRLINCKRMDIFGGWEEQLPLKITGAYPINAVSYDTDCEDIHIKNKRALREVTHGGYLSLNEDEATNTRVTLYHDRGGIAVPLQSQNLLHNPLLKLVDGTPKNWTKRGATFERVSNAPRTFSESTKITNSTTSNQPVVQKISKDLLQVGNVITLSFFSYIPKTPGINDNVDNSSIRIGFTKGLDDWSVPLSYRMSHREGMYNRWVFSQITHTITSDNLFGDLHVAIQLMAPVGGLGVTEIIVAGLSLSNTVNGAVFNNPLDEELETLRERIEALESV